MSDEQRRMAREWFLQPLDTLRIAFELGYRAAQEPGSAPHPAVALTRHGSSLSALAPRLALAAHDVEPTTPRIAPTAPAASSPLTFACTAEAAKHLEWFKNSHNGFVDDLRKWLPLDEQGIRLALSRPHAGSLGSADLAFIEPMGRAVALVQRATLPAPIVHRFVLVMREDRPALLARPSSP